MIELADGTILENTYVRESSGKLWFYVQNGMSIQEVFALMSDPEKTERIIQNDDTEHPVVGYVNIYSIQRNDTLISGGIDKA